MNFQFGVPAPCNIEAVCLAARVRTANKTLDAWQLHDVKLREAFEDHAVLYQVRNEPKHDRWMSPEHWCMKPFAQALGECMFVDRFDVRFGDTVFAKFRPHTQHDINLALSHTGGSLQAAVYKCIVRDQPEADFAAFIRRHNLKHLRKYDHALLDDACDTIRDNIHATCKKLAKCRNKYGVLAVIKFLTDSFCTPARFGQAARCPCCAGEGRSFSVAHLACCNEASSFLVSVLSEQVLAIIDAELHGNHSCILVMLLSRFHVGSKKLLQASTSIFALLALLISSCVAGPTTSLAEIAVRLRQASI
jgi:hypothetical protein